MKFGITSGGITVGCCAESDFGMASGAPDVEKIDVLGC
jgi:hypothetical protein